MKKVLIIIIKVISIILIVLPLLLALPGVVLNILSEEMENKSIEDNVKDYFN
jgi:hypothetical protein